MRQRTKNVGLCRVNWSPKEKAYKNTKEYYISVQDTAPCSVTIISNVTTNLCDEQPWSLCSLLWVIRSDFSVLFRHSLLVLIGWIPIHLSAVFVGSLTWNQATDHTNVLHALCLAPQQSDINKNDEEHSKKKKKTRRQEGKENRDHDRDITLPSTGLTEKCSTTKFMKVLIMNDAVKKWLYLKYSQQKKIISTI